MKTISPALAALFASNDEFAVADLYTFTFIDGAVLRTTSADCILSFGGNTWLSCSPICERTRTTLKIGVEVDEMTITVKPTTGNLVGGVRWPRAAREGYLDGATVLVERAYLQTWPTVVGTIWVFEGNASDVDPTGLKVDITVKSPLELLAREFPRNVFQSVCLHTVYDTGCALSKASYTATSTVTASPAPTTTAIDTTLAQAAGYFDQGVLTFTSGALAGLKRTVKAHTSGGGLNWALPLPAVPAVGDTISVFAGCDKRLATCRSKFSNSGRFRGYPWVPTPETIR